MGCSFGGSDFGPAGCAPPFDCSGGAFSGLGSPPFGAGTGEDGVVASAAATAAGDEGDFGVVEGPEGADPSDGVVEFAGESGPSVVVLSSVTSAGPLASGLSSAAVVVVVAVMLSLGVTLTSSVCPLAVTGATPVSGVVVFSSVVCGSASSDNFTRHFHFENGNHAKKSRKMYQDDYFLITFDHVGNNFCGNLVNT